MSVIVKGMEMPKSCSKCGWFDMGGGYGYQCTLSHKSFDMWNKISVARDKDCPLVEIPTPHGRLIDKDKLRHELFVNFNGERIPFYDYDNFPTKIAYRDLHSILVEQKTVIEAEGETE